MHDTSGEISLLADADMKINPHIHLIIATDDGDGLLSDTQEISVNDYKS